MFRLLPQYKIKEILQIKPKVKKVIVKVEHKEKVTLVCKNCKVEFKVQEFLADQGRKYCGIECMRIGRGFKVDN